MKKIIISFVFIITMSWNMVAQTNGELLVTVTTSETGGNYAPRNIVAIWVEDDNGNFVKTLLAYANTRKTHLNTWQASTTAAGTAYNTTDAISGATRSSHSTRSCTWNGTDFNGLDVADGTYYLWLELTDKNSTGNFSSFQFVKGEDDQFLTPDDVPSFASISINWDAIITSVFTQNEYPEISIHPNPSQGSFTVQGDNIKEVEVRTISGELILISNSSIVDISDAKPGFYLITVKTDKTRVVKKLIKE